MQIDLQELGSVDLGDGWALLGSSWSGTEPGAESAATVGGSLGLLRQQDDGSWQIHWVVSNSWPATM